MVTFGLKMTWNISTLFLFVGFVVSGTGCAVGTMQVDHRVPGKENLSILDNEHSLVLGKFEGVLECASQYEAGKIITRPFKSYVVLSKTDAGKSELIIEENRKRYTESDYPFYGWLPANESDWFVWVLPVGEYEISSIRVNDAQYIEPANLQFKVLETGKAYYIGDVKFILRDQVYIDGLCSGHNEMSLLNNMASAKQYIQQYSHAWDDRFEIQLMVLVEANKSKLSLIRRNESKFKYLPDPFVEVMKDIRPIFSY